MTGGARPNRIALLRGINITGRNMVPMAALRGVAEGLGWTDVRTYIQSGNVIFRAASAAAELESRLEQAVQHAFGCAVPVLVRGAAEWAEYVRGNPFGEAALREPNRVMLALSKQPPAAAAVAGLHERASSGEQIVRVGDAIWIYYADGVGRSRVTPGLLDRHAGSPVTTRNWRTVLMLQELVEGATGPQS